MLTRSFIRASGAKEGARALSTAASADNKDE